MLVCDMCDKGYHTFCLQPVMESIPTNGWRCKVRVGKAGAGWGDVTAFIVSLAGGLPPSRHPPTLAHYRKLQRAQVLSQKQAGWGGLVGGHATADFFTGVLGASDRPPCPQAQAKEMDVSAFLFSQ